MNLQQLQTALGYCFNDEALLLRALSHSSYANERRLPGGSNERLEFLGDSVLGFLTAELFYARYPQKPEGELTRLRAAAVCEAALFCYAQRIGLGEYLLLGRGEAAAGGAERPSMVADAFEAVLAAMYLDGGMEPCRTFVQACLEQNTTEEVVTDNKTRLQQIVQQSPEETVEYVLTNESGPDHNKHFVVEVRLHSNVLGTGEGRSKKTAEQAAAGEALRLMGVAPAAPLHVH